MELICMYYHPGSETGGSLNLRTAVSWEQYSELEIHCVEETSKAPLICPLASTEKQKRSHVQNATLERLVEKVTVCLPGNLTRDGTTFIQGHGQTRRLLQGGTSFFLHHLLSVCSDPESPVPSSLTRPMGFMRISFTATGRKPDLWHHLSLLIN